MLHVLLTMPRPSMRMTPIRDTNTSRLLSPQLLLTRLSIIRIMKHPAVAANILPPVRPAVGVDEMARQQEYLVILGLVLRKRSHRGEIFDRVSEGRPLADLVLFVLDDAVAQGDGSGDAFGGVDPVVGRRFVVDAHDVLDRYKEEGVAWCGGHPGVGDRVFKARVGAHATKNGSVGQRCFRSPEYGAVFMFKILRGV